ncbi:hypothetical protein ACO0R3_000013 [Hanseniaspora guilliermondii]
MHVKPIPVKHFKELRDFYHTEVVCLSRTYIIKNELFVKRLNKLVIQSKDGYFEMYVNIACLDINDDDMCVSPGIYYELSLSSLISDVQITFSTFGEDEHAIVSELKLQRCFDQNHVNVENRNVIDDILINSLKNNYKKCIFRNGMFIPISYLNNVVWFRVILNTQTSFKVKEINELIIDNQNFSGAFALDYNTYPDWHMYYSARCKQFSYGENWPTYNDIASLILNNKNPIGLLLYSDTNGESVGLFGKTHMIKTFAKYNGLVLIQADIVDLCEDNEDLNIKFHKLKTLVDTYTKIIDERLLNVTKNKMLFLFKNVHLLYSKDAQSDPSIIKFYTLFHNLLINYNVVFTSNSLDTTNVDFIRSLCVKEIYVGILNEDQRFDILKQSDYFEDLELNSNINNYSFLKNLAKETNSFTPYMLERLISKCKVHRLNTEKSIKTKVEEMKKIKASNAGAPTVPKVLWEDIGGLAHVKEEIIKTLDPPKGSLKKTLKRSGLLLFGVPGSGKTLLAKAIATNFSMNFFSVKGPELLDMYIGESESNIRKIFKKACDNKPCVLFFDELDSIASKNHNSNMDRVVAQTLNEIDRVNQTGDVNVFVVGATNRPDLIDDSFTRPGRFDKLIYLGVIDSNEEKINVLKTVTRYLKMDFEWDKELSFVENKVPNNLTGADYQNLINQVYNHVVEERIKVIQSDHIELNKEEWNEKLTDIEWFGNDSNKLIIALNHFEHVLKDFKSSVSGVDLKKYEALRDKYCN